MALTDLADSILTCKHCEENGDPFIASSTVLSIKAHTAGKGSQQRFVRWKERSYRP